ncbi:restriction endonuclease [Serinicoccus chungangensis]|uniref:Restriction endonuclease n=2 Tax=Serinicoccus chungangensis TaxID=767452 RepID=A0A0W8I8Y6_9MICO|nr:restriction endonuclease [Serinicoccus chungangensis]
MAHSPAPRWSQDQLAEHAAMAVRDFRDVRMHEPLEQYLETFDQYRTAVENLIEGTVDLSRLSDEAVEYVTDPHLLTAVRYLASPAVSEDDLKILAEAVLSPGRLRKDPEMAKRVIETVMLGLDRNRFPWVSEDREPSQAEREMAIISTTALIATQRVQTDRRNSAKNVQEDAVAEYLLSIGLTQVANRSVRTARDLPSPGEFCRESLFGSRKADLIVSLWDGRAMPTECKVSNSSTNSVKRLNNDAAKKAKTWNEEFGSANTVPAAVLSGVFKVHNLEQAQADDLTIFWAHDLEAMGAFIESTLS